MSSPWTPLLPLAMVGTDRSPAWPAWLGEIGQFLAGVAEQAPEPATAALQVAGCLTTCSLAGATGLAWTSPLPAPADPDSLPALDGSALPDTLEWAWREGPARLHHDICQALTRARYRLPAALLPAALDQGRRSLALRPALGPVLGERGRWLAARRAEWGFATGLGQDLSEEQAWHEGRAEQRLAFLAHERRQSPAAARQRLQQALGELSAKERADLATVLSDQLSLDDEALLDKLRADRSREVRSAALGLLLQLPQAAHPRRAMNRMAALLRHERQLLRRRWVVEAPGAAADDWPADQLDAARPPQESLGERAWWLYQVARQVPLAWWTTHLGMNARELCQWAEGTDWHEALLRAWRDVLLAAPEPEWCEALLERWKETRLRDHPATILALLPRPNRERLWLAHLRQSGAAALPTVVPQVMQACPVGETLAAPLSCLLADLLAGHAASDATLRWHLPELCCLLHPDALPQVARWPRSADEPPSIAALWHTVARIIATRQSLLLLSPASAP